MNGNVLAFDIVAVVVTTAMLPALWAALYLLAWERRAFAESVGLGRRAFWLLVPGGLLASFAAFPLAPVGNAWTAVSLAGAIFPLLVGIAALGRYAPPLGRSVALYLGLLGVEGVALFVFVIPQTAGWVAAFGSSLALPAPTASIVLVTLGAAVFSVAVGFYAYWSGGPSTARVAVLVALTSGVLALTFAGSTAIPNVGIAESYPFFLLPPFVAGVVAGFGAPWAFRNEEGFALPAAFLASTFGVLLGADLLRQPGLYPGGRPGLYTIGGAGVLDLVYLSGLLAFGGALVVHLLLRRGWDPVGPALPAERGSPTGSLRRAFVEGSEGRNEASLQSAAHAARGAADQARLLLAQGEPSGDRPWTGLPVPGWFTSDQANLDAAARSGSEDGREAFRGWLTARSLVVVGASLGRARFASLGERSVAFGVDLAVVGGPAVLVFVGIGLATPGDMFDLLGSVAFNAAIYGFVAVALLYFALGETWTGRTVGKAIQKLRVTDRDLRPVGGLPALLRNSARLPLLTLFGVGVAVGVAAFLKGIATTGGTVAGLGVPSALLTGLGAIAIAAAGVGLFGLLSAVTILATAERQRIGDLWARTWVVRGLSRSPRTELPPAPAEPADLRSG